MCLWQRAFYKDRENEPVAFDRIYPPVTGNSLFADGHTCAVRFLHRVLWIILKKNYHLEFVASKSASCNWSARNGQFILFGSQTVTRKNRENWYIWKKANRLLTFECDDTSGTDGTEILHIIEGNIMTISIIVNASWNSQRIKLA